MRAGRGNGGRGAAGRAAPGAQCSRAAAAGPGGVLRAGRSLGTAPGGRRAGEHPLAAGPAALGFAARLTFLSPLLEAVCFAAVIPEASAPGGDCAGRFGRAAWGRRRAGQPAGGRGELWYLGAAGSVKAEPNPEKHVAISHVEGASLGGWEL